MSITTRLSTYALEQFMKKCSSTISGKSKEIRITQEEAIELMQAINLLLLQQTTLSQDIIQTQKKIIELQGTSIGNMSEVSLDGGGF